MPDYSRYEFIKVEKGNVVGQASQSARAIEIGKALRTVKTVRGVGPVHDLQIDMFGERCCAPARVV